MQKKHNDFALVCWLFALPIYTIRPAHLYHTPYSFIPHTAPLYTIRTTPFYYTAYSFIPHAPPIYTTRPTHLLLYTLPLYTKKIINKAAKAR